MKKTLEKQLLKPALAFCLRLLFRVRVLGLENYHDANRLADGRVVIIPNHVSFLDPLLISVFLPTKPAFAMNLYQARKWYFCWLDWLIKIYRIDPLAPMSLKRLMGDVKNGAKLVIFPEGRISNTGGIMKIYDGAGRIIEKTGACVLPVNISGAEYSKFGRLGGKIRTKFFPQITISFLPPKKFEAGAEISALQIYDLLTDAKFAASDYKKPLLAAILDAASLHGKSQIIATDPTRATLNYRQLFTRAFVLSDKLEDVLADSSLRARRSNPEKSDKDWIATSDVSPRNNEKIETKFVGVLLPNSLGALVAFVALQILGKVPAMLNFSAGVANIMHACNLATVQTVLTSRAFVEKGKLEHIITALEQKYQVIYLEDIRPSVTIFDKINGLINAIFAHDNLRARLARTDPNSPAVILFTSGSEGVPKGVALSHTNLLSNINQSCAVLDLTPADVLFNAMPVFHSFGLTVGMLLPLTQGIQTFLYPTPLHYRVIPELIYDASATVVLGTDTFFNGYAKYANAYDFNSVRLAVLGAEKLKESTRKLYADKFRVNLLQGYGVTEASPVISFNTPLANKVGSVGRAFPEIECRLEPVEGLDVGGRLFVRGANIMLGYIRENNVGVVEPQGEWYDTGDIVDIDADGFITILGRAKRFAKIAGEMVSLMICEELAGHLFTDAAHAAIAFSDERKGEHIVLYSEAEGLTREALANAAREKGLPEIYMPKHIVYIEQIPRLGNGKIDYPSLKIIAMIDKEN